MIEELGPYRIEKVLGRGGMGTVYEGVHKESGQRAAIKALSFVHADDDNFRQRFMSEIETLKQLQHPNIVQLYGNGEQDGHLFYAMELVDGKTLQEELQAGRKFTWQEVTQIAIEISQALKHAHDHGIVHRDLKPANLMRTPEGKLKLTDFGIAKLFGATHLTADGSVVGTADFMAPEQAEGRPVSNRTDLYSLGNVMFTLLARRPPFSAPSIPQLVHRLRYEEAPPVRRYAPEVPVELDQIISQLLQKEPAHRIATALVLTKRLRAMQHALAPGTGVAKGGLTDKHHDPIADSSHDQATRISHATQSPATEVAPTTVDPGSSLEQGQGRGWNEATMITSGESPLSEAKSRAHDDTVVDPASRPNRFVTVEEERDQRSRQDVAGNAKYWQAALLAAALVGLIAAVIWGLQPPSADTLHDRIATIAAEGDVRDARQEIDQFLTLFPQDPRAQAVREWQLDVHSKFLFSRLTNRAKRQKLSPVQSDFVEAMKLLEDQPDRAREAFQRLLDEHRDATDQPDPITSLQAARHQLNRLHGQYHSSP